MNYKSLNNNFIYAFSEDGSLVTIAYKALLSNIAGQMIVAEQMRGVLLHTGKYQDVHYAGHIYTGLVYHNTISEKELVKALSVTK